MFLSIFPYVFMVLALSGALALFLSLKREMNVSTRREEKRVDTLYERLQEAHERPAPADVFLQNIPILVGSGVNMSKRVHATRMMRRGEDVSHIAAALGVPRREVELLMRVQEMSKAHAASSSS